MDLRGDGRVTTKTWLIRDVWTLSFKKMVFFCNSCPQFAKHTSHKSLHKGWFFNTLEQPCVFQKHLSVVGLPLILLLGAPEWISVVGRNPTVTSANFWPLSFVVSGISGDSSDSAPGNRSKSYLWTSSYLVLFNLGATHLTNWVSSWNI